MTDQEKCDHEWVVHKDGKRVDPAYCRTCGAIEEPKRRRRTERRESMTPVPPPNHEDFDADEYRILLDAWLEELRLGLDPRVTMRAYMV